MKENFKGHIDNNCWVSKHAEYTEELEKYCDVLEMRVDELEHQCKNEYKCTVNKILAEENLMAIRKKNEYWNALEKACKEIADIFDCPCNIYGECPKLQEDCFDQYVDCWMSYFLEKGEQ